MLRLLVQVLLALIEAEAIRIPFHSYVTDGQHKFWTFCNLIDG